MRKLPHLLLYIIALGLGEGTPLIVPSDRCLLNFVYDI